MDQFDRAQELEMASRNHAIMQQRQKQNDKSLSHCQDCGEAIAENRQKIGGIIRCIGCQQLTENKQKRGLKF